MKHKKYYLAATLAAVTLASGIAIGTSLADPSDFSIANTKTLHIVFASGSVNAFTIDTMIKYALVHKQKFGSDIEVVLIGLSPVIVSTTTHINNPTETPTMLRSILDGQSNKIFSLEGNDFNAGMPDAALTAQLKADIDADVAAGIPVKICGLAIGGINGLLNSFGYNNLTLIDQNITVVPSGDEEIAIREQGGYQYVAFSF